MVTSSSADIGRALAPFTGALPYFPDGAPFVAADRPPAQDPRCRWDEDPEGWQDRATEHHAQFGYQVGEPVLHQIWTFFSYGYNGWGSRGSVGDVNKRTHRGLGWDVFKTHPLDSDGELPASQVRRPSQMIAIADTMADGWADFTIMPKAPFGGPFGNSPQGRGPGTIHAGGANVLFCDGHVQWYLQKDLLHTNGIDAAGQAMNRMWNNDHEYHHD